MGRCRDRDRGISVDDLRVSIVKGNLGEGAGSDIGRAKIWVGEPSDERRDAARLGDLIGRARSPGFMSWQLEYVEGRAGMRNGRD